MRVLFAAALLAVAFPVLADETSGTVAGYDPVRNVLTLSDRTVWDLPADAAVPDALVPGERLRIVYDSAADNGWTRIVRIERIPG